jgi:hypothetical protein
MSQVIEVPGVGNVEFPDEMNNEDISHAIKNHIIPQHQTEQVSAGGSPENTAALTGAALAVPAIAKTAAAVPEAYQTAKTIATPAASGVWNLGKTYLQNPKTAVVDIASAKMGLPPPTATKTAYEGIGNTYQAVQDWMNKAGQFAPQTTPAAPSAMDVANEARRNAVVNAVHDHISANPSAMQDFAPHLGDTEKMAQVATQKGIPIPGVNNIPSAGPATTQTVGTADNFMSRMASLADKYGKPVTNALSSIAESPVGRAVGTAARIAGSTPVVGAQLMLHSPELNSNEDNEIKLMHEKQDLERQQLANKHATEMHKYVQTQKSIGSQ